MRTMILFAVLFLSCQGCKKSVAEQNRNDVEMFVSQLKKGTYRNFEVGQKGENLWLLMPKFTPGHIPYLLDFSADTAHIENFPTNPVSSRFPIPEGRSYFILGECLLWTVEGVRKGREYGSLDPYLIDTMAINKYKGLNGAEILNVRAYYLKWWNDSKDKDLKNTNPLTGTSYIWQ